jgi:hypothetical protein
MAAQLERAGHPDNDHDEPPDPPAYDLATHQERRAAAAPAA